MRRLNSGLVQGVYLNPKQIQFLQCTQPDKTYLGGRSAGKSFVLGIQIGVQVKAMPKAVVGLLGPTYNMLKNNTYPSVKSALRSMGYIEQTSRNLGHFVAFRKPPEHWEKPFNEIADYDNCITFSNGFTIRLMSWSHPEVIRGTSIDALHVDEAALLDKDTFDTIFLPTVRGNLFKYEKNPYHNQICYYSTMPWANSGAWLLEKQKLSIEYPEEYAFVKATSWDNVEVIGEKVLKRWEREMLPLVYQVEVMCEAINSVPNAFYHQFSENKHLYTPRTVFSSVGRDKSYLVEREDLPLLVSFDFNANFICCVIGQYEQEYNRITIIHELFTKTSSLDNIIDEFCTIFENVAKKEVLLFGDRSGYNKVIDFKSGVTIFEKIVTGFNEYGWNAITHAKISYANHQLKNEIINDCLAAQKPSMPTIRFNRMSCTYLKLNLVKTPMLLDFRKDKSSETDEHTPPEQATHLTDAFDYLVVPIAEKRYGKALSASPTKLIKLIGNS